MSRPWSSQWVTLEQLAQTKRITLAEATALADRERWPKVFRLHGTLVLAPADRTD